MAANHPQTKEIPTPTKQACNDLFPIAEVAQAARRSQAELEAWLRRYRQAHGLPEGIASIEDSLTWVHVSEVDALAAMIAARQTLAAGGDTSGYAPAPRPPRRAGSASQGRPHASGTTRPSSRRKDSAPGEDDREAVPAGKRRCTGCDQIKFIRTHFPHERSHLCDRCLATDAGGSVWAVGSAGSPGLGRRR